jgi:hypothetical protein
MKRRTQTSLPGFDRWLAVVEQDGPSDEALAGHAQSVRDAEARALDNQ